MEALEAPTCQPLRQWPSHAWESIALRSTPCDNRLCSYLKGRGEEP